jgi:NAD(P)-dependent dehydrogenase (short-subunit alcohol dehydrogenase family)
MTDRSSVRGQPTVEQMLDLSEKVYVVIGAGQGIGRAAALALASAGARLICVDSVDTRAAEVAAEVSGTPWSGDVTVRADAAELFDFAARAGGIDGVVNIVGMARPTPILNITDEMWDREFDISLRHVWLTMQYSYPLLAERGGGTLAFVSSASGVGSAPYHAAYGAAKAALISLVKSAAIEFAGAGIRVNAVAPGTVATPRFVDFLGEEGVGLNARNAPLGRMGTPFDIAAALLFLSSPMSAFITGQILVADGGVGVKNAYPVENVGRKSH